VIFVTVGAQMPFDRLVSAVDAWAGSARGPGQGAGPGVIAQIGPGNLRPRNIRWSRMLTPAQFRQCVSDSSLVVAHAGMGTILTALEIGRPLLVMPRRGDLGETRNDHQIATAERFRSVRGVRVVLDADELTRALDGAGVIGAAQTDGSAQSGTSSVAPDRVPAGASPELVAMLREFILGRDPPAHGGPGGRS
jgi:UDP-N-acetylglucosamine transferase subunit ALG13